MANTTADKLALLATNKANIKAAINAKNPATAPTDVMSQWPTAIASIPTGIPIFPMTAAEKWVHTTGNSYFILNKAPYAEETWGIMFTPQLNIAVSSFNIPIGGRSESGVNDYELYYSAGSYMIRFGNSGSNFNNVGTFTLNVKYANHPYLVEASNGRFVCQNGDVDFLISGQMNSATFNSHVNVCVGANNNNGTIANPFAGKIHEVYCKKNGEYLIHLLPRIVNGVVGMYDDVNDLFYTSNTSTPFTYGEV